MKYCNFLLLTITALVANFSLAAPALKEGRDYIVLDHPIQSTHPDKVELVEVFSYLCMGCKKFDPILQEYEKNLKDSKVAFRNIHVFWNPKFMNLIRLSIAVSDNKMTEVANTHIFNATLNERVNLLDEKTTINWLNTQTAFDGKKIAVSYQSQENKNKAKQVSTLTKQYQFENTPSVIVGEKYKVNQAAIKSESDLARILDGLIDLAKKDKLPINTLLNSGAELTYKANQAK